MDGRKQLFLLQTPGAPLSPTITGMSVLFEAQNLRKRYKKRTVVEDVSFTVGSGEVVGLLGPNGAGKTTCFYMVVGLIACVGPPST